jgi:hypothetical protein
MIRVKFASECMQCECCGEPWCEDHEEHYAECPCVGPSQDGYEYEERDDGLWAIPIEEQEENAVTGLQTRKH